MMGGPNSMPSKVKTMITARPKQPFIRAKQPAGFPSAKFFSRFIVEFSMPKLRPWIIQKTDDIHSVSMSEIIVMPTLK